jgi:predicted cupin superfamily sugar epimerase
MAGMMTADEVIASLALIRHPEGGWYREAFRDAPARDGGRGRMTHIQYLLREGERSHWHRIDAIELWHYAVGDALELKIAVPGAPTRAYLLGPDLRRGHGAHAVVPPHAWQSARPLGAWTLVGCTVAPAFDFAGFEMAPAGWEPHAG